MGSATSRKSVRLKKQTRIRNRIVGTTARPRLCVFRSSKHINAQVIDDTLGVLLKHQDDIRHTRTELVARLASSNG